MNSYQVKPITAAWKWLPSAIILAYPLIGWINREPILLGGIPSTPDPIIGPCPWPSPATRPLTFPPCPSCATPCLVPGAWAWAAGWFGGHATRLWILSVCLLGRVFLLRGLGSRAHEEGCLLDRRSGLWGGRWGWWRGCQVSCSWVDGAFPYNINNKFNMSSKE